MESSFTIFIQSAVCVFVQAVVIVATAYVCSAVASYLHQPMVVGKIIGGLILGPSVLGKFFPGISDAVFHPSTILWLGIDLRIDQHAVWFLQHAADMVGLIPFLLMVGMQFDFSHLRHNSKAVTAISLNGIFWPFLLGCAMGPWVQSVTGSTAHPWLFSFFLGVCMSITALPVLGGMMKEWGVTQTVLATIVISAAAFDDAVGWVLLSVANAAATIGWQWQQTLLMVSLIAFYIAVMFFIVRPLMHVLLAIIMRRGTVMTEGLALLGFTLLFSAWATHAMGIFSIFGSFFLGAVLSNEKEFCQIVITKIGPIVDKWFIPIFFTATGLRLNIDTAGGSEIWFLCVVITATAMVGKIGGCGIAAYFFGSQFTVREALCIGVLMNTRALMELIVINVGFELGIFSSAHFFAMVVMAVVTTVIVTPMVRLLAKGTELAVGVFASSAEKHEPQIRQLA